MDTHPGLCLPRGFLPGPSSPSLSHGVLRMSDTVTVRFQSEPLVPVPDWDHDPFRLVWRRVGRGKRPKGKWKRPMLPPNPDTPRAILSKAPLWAMTQADRERAEVVLAVYLKSHGGEITLPDFMEMGPGFAFKAYPGPPVHYLPTEVLTLACCLGKNHRWIDHSLPLRNPVVYCFCQTHWQAFLQESFDRGRVLEIPDFPPYVPLEPDSSVNPHGPKGCPHGTWDITTSTSGATGSAKPVACNLPLGHTGSHRSGFGLWYREWPTLLPERCWKAIGVGPCLTTYCRSLPGHRGKCSKRLWRPPEEPLSTHPG